MASGIFTILDDIAALMDDVAVASKIATKQTAGILGDDLAVNAEKATGFVSSRELPVLWAITKGSFINKLIIVPLVLLLNFFFPIAIKWLLIVGACYLAYEGVEKIIHYLFHKNQKNVEQEVVNSEIVDASTQEQTKIKDAIKTDFILSVEIVIIALGSVMKENLAVMVLTVSVVSIIATVGVYGLVAMVVRMDDVGFRFIALSKGKGILNKLGLALVKTLPYIIKMFAIVGTIALILVAGGIFHHQIEYFHHLLHFSPNIINEVILGLSFGVVLVILMQIFVLIKKLFNK